jgi:ATP-dependent RNA helicase DDX60
MARSDRKSKMAGEKENGSAADNADELLRWYDSLFSRRVDLVGDYAGNELFLVEGDSLLLHCFSDPRIDFNGKPALTALNPTERWC